jgi:hypothetical protein
MRVFHKRDQVRVLTLRDEISPSYKSCLHEDADEFIVNAVIPKGTRVADYE